MQELPGFLLYHALIGLFQLAALVLAVLLWLAVQSRKLPDLHLWHRTVLRHEFRAKDAPPAMTFEAYQAREDAVFGELEERIYSQVPPRDRLPYNRYNPESFSHPERFAHNWNRSFEMRPPTVRGGVLLLHGLTDSPYSLHAIGRIACDQGLYALGIRMPGHGTVPAELTRTSWQDWLAAARIGLARVKAQIGPDAPLYLCGYSTGGTLALKLALDALEHGDSDLPDRLILFSPALAVTAFGAFADWHWPLSVLPAFEKFAWFAVNPEYEPFKYTSFAKHAGGQVYHLARLVQAQVKRLKKRGLLHALPPITAFQSVVDSTVMNTALVSALYSKLESNHSELVLFDVNQHAHVRHFIKRAYRAPFPGIDPNAPLPYTLTMITNEHDASLNVAANTKPAHARAFRPPQPLGLAWPSDVYSLSHVALLFPPDDPIYGTIDSRPAPESFKLGTLAPRGETTVLNVSLEHIMRIRCNPFFPYVEQRLTELLTGREAP